MAANSFVTPTKVMKEVTRRLVNNLRFGNNVNRSYSSEFKTDGAKVGYTVNARLPQRYVVNKGQALNAQAVDDKIVPITLTDQANVGLEFSMSSITMEIDNYRSRYIDPAVDALINAFDHDGLTRMYQATFYTVGTPGVVPGSTGTLPQAASNVYMSAVTKLADVAVPTNALIAMLSPNMHQYLVTAHMALFNPAERIAKNFSTGQFGGEALGVSKWFMDQNVAAHQIGPLGGTPLVNIAAPVAEGSSAIVTDGWTAVAARRLNKGDVVQFAGVFAINPMNYTSTGWLQDFVVTANVDSDGAGNATIPVYPPLITVGPNATVSAMPVDGAAVTTFGHASSFAGILSRQGLVYHMDAYAAVMADLEKPGGVWVGERIGNKALGIAVRFIKDYDVRTDQSPARLDILYGWKAIRPEMAARIAA